MKGKREMTMGEHLVRTVGWRKAAQVQGLLVAWAAWLRTHDGQAPTIDILAGESEKSRAQWFRYQAAFRLAFPNEASPDRIARLLAGDLQSDSVRIMSVPMGALS